MNVQVSKLFSLVGRLAHAAGARDLALRPGCWEYRIGELELALNPHRHPTLSRICEIPIPSLSCYLQHRGMPAGIAGLCGGLAVGGDAESESISIIESEIARLEASAPEPAAAPPS